MLFEFTKGKRLSIHKKEDYLNFIRFDINCLKVNFQGYNPIMMTQLIKFLRLLRNFNKILVTQVNEDNYNVGGYFQVNI